MAMDDGRWTMLIDTVQRTRLQCLVSHAIGMCAGCNAVAGVSEVQAALISSVRPKASAPIARFLQGVVGPPPDEISRLLAWILAGNLWVATGDIDSRHRGVGGAK
eukprot:3928171-Pyramimonas_sp.AAC.2